MLDISYSGQFKKDGLFRNSVEMQTLVDIGYNTVLVT